MKRSFYFYFFNVSFILLNTSGQINQFWIWGRNFSSRNCFWFHFIRRVIFKLNMMKDFPAPTAVKWGFLLLRELDSESDPHQQRVLHCSPCFRAGWLCPLTQLPFIVTSGKQLSVLQVSDTCNKRSFNGGPECNWTIQFGHWIVQRCFINGYTEDGRPTQLGFSFCYFSFFE